MVESYLRQSPLAHLHLIGRAETPVATAGLRMGEKPFSHQFVLRGDAGDADFCAAVADNLGAALPITPNTVSTGGEAAILWQGPDEWLVVAAPGAGIGGKFDAVVAGRHAAVSDVCESRTVLTLAGARVLEVLAKGCALDLHPSVFGAGQCAQSMLAKAHVILHQTSDAPEFEIYVHRSFAEYLWAWLEDAGAEYGVSIGP